MKEEQDQPLKGWRILLSVHISHILALLVLKGRELKTKTIKIALEGFGSYLGMEKGCFLVKDREGNTRTRATK